MDETHTDRLMRPRAVDDGMVIVPFTPPPLPEPDASEWLPVPDTGTFAGAAGHVGPGAGHTESDSDPAPHPAGATIRLAVDEAIDPAPTRQETLVAFDAAFAGTRQSEAPPDVSDRVQPPSAPSIDLRRDVSAPPTGPSTDPGSRRRRRDRPWADLSRRSATAPDQSVSAVPTLAGLEAQAVSAWFGDHQVLDRVSLSMQPGAVTALIGPSGCGKSTFLRILNRMHELIPSAGLAGQVLLDGADVYDPRRKVIDARRQIGMVFQKPNPFPAMSIYDNVLAGLRLTGSRADQATKDRLVEECLTKAGLWKEVRDRLRQPGGALSGGQQQRLCIARSLAVRPRVLLMDEPCSALDPTSTRRIEETIGELVTEVTIVIVTHNMQQAARVSNSCAFFLAEQGVPGFIVEHGPTDAMFGAPQDPRTADYVAGRFG